MKKAFQILVILLPVVMMATGCDFFRKLAGRPTSQDIAAKVEYIRAEEEAAQARRDSIEAVKKHEADSIAAMEIISKEKVFTPEKFGGLAGETGKLRHYVILGAFASPANAERFAKDLTTKGYPAEAIPFKKGYTAVGVGGSDDVVAFCERLQEIKRQDFCPDAAWILENVNQ